MSNAPHIVSTRKLTSNKVAELQAKGWKFTDHDFISKVIEIPSDLRAQSIHQHVALTSITGVKAFLQIANQLHLNYSNYTVYCISRGTSEYAIASGLSVKSTAVNASMLADEILNDAAVKEVTHVCNNLRRDELSNKLIKAGVVIQDVIAYQTKFTPVAIDPSYDALVFFSPSAVDSFLSLNPFQQVPCFCIGQTTADHAKQKGYQRTYIPDAPSEAILLQTIVNHYSKSTHVKE